MSGRGIVQGEDTGQLSFDGAEYRVFHMEPLGSSTSISFIKAAEPTRTWSPRDGGRQAASLIQQHRCSAFRKMEPWARSRSWNSLVRPLPESRIRVAVYPTTRSMDQSPNTFDAVELHIAGREQVAVGEEDAVPFPDWAVPGHPARAAPLEASRRASLWKGRPYTRAPPKAAEAVKVAERHHNRCWGLSSP